MTRIIVFAKAPVPGRVKTRLIPALGADGAAALARVMLIRTLDVAISSAVGEVELCMDPAPGAPSWQGITLPPGLSLSPQEQGDLGERMARAVMRRIDELPVILIGTDCVQISKVLLRDAANALTRADAVMNPCADGGYALFGLNRFDPSLFEGIAWSTASVAARTLARLAALGWRVHVGREVHDVDSPRDLDYWYRTMALGQSRC
ncbi:TIGR04282 family arsenosugar biosynthesis glycosyltransferase [Azoarcus taiwanensis]|uniref:DUF2064 domain-containing protein n=1 Tax=Azoarcus taiwanensis TaxID=666964 RepID=A0A972F606_9RHOO|nr:TIGR04282 family arsenosugar biosynthesis glycosyltransferase [Azoarcus taiwanensis]NMG02081.1 DUF2064 domain-containing protein [Azoarcus taiwanensis]